LQRVEEGDDAVTIGRPIANTQVYLLDAGHRPVPTGFTGELWIGGDGLARGYRNRPDLTSEAFRDIALPTGETKRLYRTGDLARWNRDGVLECLGRVDFQVKVRGVRIELGDIESQLEAHPAVNQAVVAKRTDLPGGEGLVAYLIPRGQAPEVSALRQYLAERLPASYLPAAFVTVSEFPLTPNRKIDRRRLPAPVSGGAATGERVMPRTPTEQKLFDIFAHYFESGKLWNHRRFLRNGRGFPSGIAHRGGNVRSL
ncbi:MAG: AMP-binding protein, partial [Verrucomicrobiae bacterium]|nr:AMP-binding protein [Verrucomicrobiae bacterium]